MKIFKNKIAVVTGSSRGIGKAIALELAQEGATVVVHASQPRLVAEKTLKMVQKYGPQSKIFYAQVENFKAVTVFADKVKNHFPSIDFLINNAGINRDRTIRKMSYKEWDEVIKVNLYGLFNVTKHLLPIIKKGGRIINISSVVGTTGAFGQSNYAASKAGIIGFSKSLAIELAKDKITVNTICPGYTKTDMVKKIPKEIFNTRILPKILLQRLASPQEIASLVTYLCSEHASYITGQILHINGGLT